MANHLDLEEQEQLDEIKHFWKQYGNAITLVLIVVLGGVAAWNGYQRWQGAQTAQAAAMYDEVERIVASGDTAQSERAFGDMRERYGSTEYAPQAGLLVGRLLFEAGKADSAKSVLGWVAGQSSDAGYASVARLRLAGLLMDSKSYDEALKVLDGVAAPEFAALVADRKADIYMLQGQRELAKKAYLSAYQQFDEQSQYRRLVLVKLNALGVSPGAADGTLAGAASGNVAEAGK